MTDVNDGQTRLTGATPKRRMNFVADPFAGPAGARVRLKRRRPNPKEV
jgi:hypothetical protein